MLTATHIREVELMMGITESPKLWYFIIAQTSYHSSIPATAWYSRGPPDFLKVFRKSGWVRKFRTKMIKVLPQFQCCEIRLDARKDERYLKYLCTGDVRRAGYKESAEEKRPYG